MSFYIKINDVFYTLDSTARIRYQKPALLTENRMHSKTDKSDHYVHLQPTVSIEGIISDVKSFRNTDNLKADRYVDGLLKAMRNYSSVSLKYRLDREEESGWFITDFDHEQTPEYGFSGNKPDGAVVQAFRVSITLKKAMAEASLKENVEVPQSYIDSLQIKGEKNATTSSYSNSESDEQREAEAERRTQFYKGNMVQWAKVFTGEEDG